MKGYRDCDSAGPDLLADRDAALGCKSEGSRPVHGRGGTPREDPEQLPPFVGSSRVHRRSGPRVISPGGLSLEPVDRGAQTQSPRVAEVVLVLRKQRQRVICRIPRILDGFAARLAVEPHELALNP